MKSWLQDNDTEMYSTYNEGKFVVAERFIITLKNKIYKYMPSVSNTVHINNLADIVNEYIYTYNSTIKMKPAGVNSCTYIDFNKENNNKDPKLQKANQT